MPDWSNPPPMYPGTGIPWQMAHRAHEIICNPNGPDQEDVTDHTDPVTAMATIPCSPLPKCRTFTSVSVNSCPESGVYNPIVALTWSLPSGEGSLSGDNVVSSQQVWRRHSAGWADDGEGVSEIMWDTYGKGNWQLIASVGPAATTFQDGGTPATSDAKYPHGRVRQVGSAIPSSVFTDPRVAGAVPGSQGYTVFPTSMFVSTGGPLLGDDWWGLASLCKSSTCEEHQYEYLVVGISRCGSLLYTPQEILLNYYTQSNSISAAADGTGSLSDVGEDYYQQEWTGKDQSTGDANIQEHQFPNVGAGCGLGVVNIPCCNLGPCAWDQTLYVECNKTTDALSAATTNYITFNLWGRDGDGAPELCFKTTGAAIINNNDPQLSNYLPLDTGSLYFSCPDGDTDDPCSNSAYVANGEAPAAAPIDASDIDLDGDGVDETPHPCKHMSVSGAGNHNTSNSGMMTFIPAVGYSGTFSFDWEVRETCGYTASATVTIAVHCPTCEDDEKRYNICDATIEQLSAEHNKASGVEQVPFSLYRKGPGSLRQGELVAATAKLTIVGYNTDGDTLTLTDAAGVSITLEITGGVTTADGSTNGSGNYIVGISGLAGPPAGCAEFSGSETRPQRGGPYVHLRR